MATYYDLKPSYKDSNGDIHTIPTYAVDSVLNTESNNAISNATVATALQGLQTATGNPVSITNAAPINAQNVRVAIEAVQDLNGYDKPWAGGATVNKFDADTFYSNYKQSDGSYRMTIGPAFSTHCNIPSSLVGVACVFSGYLKLDGDATLVNVRPAARVDGTTINGTTITSTDYTAFTLSFTPTSTDDYISINYGDGRGYLQMKELQLEAGSTATSYIPYSNVCPITGWDALRLNVSGEDTSDPTTHTKSLSTTSYGGYWDATEGVIGTTHANIASYNGETLPGAWISSMDEYTEGGTPTTGAQVVYELATPTTESVTSEEIPLSQGINNLWSDTGDVTIKHWPNNIIGQLVGLIQQSQS